MAEKQITVSQVRAQGEPFNVEAKISAVKGGYLVQGAVTWVLNGEPVMTQNDTAVASEILGACALAQLWLDRQDFRMTDGNDEEAE